MNRVESLLLTTFAKLVHVFNGGFVHKRPGASAHFESVAVVPLDLALDQLSILEHDDHRGLGLNLFLEVKELGLALRDVSISRVGRESKRD
jgi:hypothetical protein